jgi:hypothetical protein
VLLDYDRYPAFLLDRANDINVYATELAAFRDDPIGGPYLGRQNELSLREGLRGMKKREKRHHEKNGSAAHRAGGKI